MALTLFWGINLIRPFIRNRHYFDIVKIHKERGFSVLETLLYHTSFV